LRKRIYAVTARNLLPALLACLALPLTAAEYNIDSTHTYASFAIDHFGFSTQHGRFNTTQGTLHFDEETGTGTVDIRIDATSLDTGFDLRDTVLRGSEWFNVKDHPDIRFRSQRFLLSDGRPVAVEGTLTLLGETRPMRLEIQRFKCGLNLVIRKRGCGADAEGTLRRSDFGMRTGLPFIGDEVRLRIHVEAYPS